MQYHDLLRYREKYATCGRPGTGFQIKDMGRYLC